MKEKKLYDLERMVVFALSPAALRLDADFIAALHMESRIICVTETYRDLMSQYRVPTFHLPSIHTASTYEHLADLYKIEPRRSVVIATNPVHVSAANHAGFQGIYLHESRVTNDTVCSPYAEYGYAGDRATLNAVLGKVLGRVPARPVIYPSLKNVPKGRWLN